MILNSLKSIRLLPFSCRYKFGILFMDKKVFRPSYDVLIPDIDADDLNGEISEALGKKYMSSLSLKENEF